VLTLTPLGPLIDGSEGEVITRELDIRGRPLAGPGAGGTHVLDVPLGAYTATARLLVPGQGEVQLGLSDGDVRTGQPPVEAFPFVFEPVGARSGGTIGTETQEFYVVDH
jgi:hypothetical protein